MLVTGGAVRQENSNRRGAPATPTASYPYYFLFVRNEFSLPLPAYKLVIARLPFRQWEEAKAMPLGVGKTVWLTLRNACGGAGCPFQLSKELRAHFCPVFWNDSAVFIFSQHPHKTIANSRTAGQGQRRPTLLPPLAGRPAGPELRRGSGLEAGTEFVPRASCPCPGMARTCPDVLDRDGHGTSPWRGPPSRRHGLQ